MSLRLTIVALPQKKVTPLSHIQRIMIPLIILQNVSKLTPVFESDGRDKIKSEKMPPSTLISCTLRLFLFLT